VTVATCLLCEAEKITEWFHEDDDCWIAECTQCALPMVVWKLHDAAPDDQVKATLHARLAEVVARDWTFVHYVDDHMRMIPDHYHAHARPVGGFFGGSHLRRRP
jgi:hypothetical protein